MDACHRLYRALTACVLTAVVLAPSPPTGPTPALTPAHPAEDSDGRVAVVFTSSATADPREDRKRVRAQVARASSLLEGATARARTAAKRFAAATAAIPAARDRVVESRGRVVAATVAANTAVREAERAEAAVAVASRRYARSAQRVLAARERVNSFIGAAYKGGDIVTINVLLGSRTVADVIQRSGYVDRILTVERGSVDDLMTARRAAKQDELDAELARRKVDRARRAAQAALSAARTAQVRAQRAVGDLVALTGQRERALRVAREERSDSLARYRQAKAEAARVAAELRAWEGRQGRHRGPNLRPGARLLMPVRGWKSSDFGMRFDPFFRVWQLHAGVDLAAGGGQPIFAAADGRVIRAGYDGGYGNFTCLSHGRHLGRGLSTCYAHQSSIGVSPGQSVRRGQVIGRVGTTGASTGNHLHFEVRVDGNPIQPLRWLPRCLC